MPVATTTEYHSTIIELPVELDSRTYRNGGPDSDGHWHPGGGSESGTMLLFYPSTFCSSCPSQETVLNRKNRGPSQGRSHGVRRQNIENNQETVTGEYPRAGAEAEPPSLSRRPLRVSNERTALLLGTSKYWKSRRRPSKALPMEVLPVLRRPGSQPGRAWLEHRAESADRRVS